MRRPRRSPAANVDLRDQPSYPLSEAARYVKVPVATLRSWVLGRGYQTTQGPKHFPRIVEPACERPLLLSFWNLVEAHVLRALRTDHGVPVRAVRDALAYAERDLGERRLLLSSELLTGEGRLFLDRYSELIELSMSGQLAMRQMLEAHLARVEWDTSRFPIKLYPFLSTTGFPSDRSILIDPSIAFGRPILVGRGIATAVIADRIDAGETVDVLAEDYDVSPRDIEQAVVYERAA